MPENLEHHAIGIDNPDRWIFVDERLAPDLRAEGDWAAVIVGVGEPWFERGPDRPVDEAIPAALARVSLTTYDEAGESTEPAIHVELTHNPELSGVAGRLIVTFDTADEALHLGRLLIRAAEIALGLARKTQDDSAKLLEDGL